MIFRGQYLRAIRVVTAFIAVTAGQCGRAILSESVCCNLKTDKKPESQTVLSAELPQASSSCKWVRDFPGEIVFLGFKTLIIAVHLGCYEGLGIQKHTEDHLFEVDAATGRLLRRALWREDNPQVRHSSIQLFALDSETILFRSGNVLRVLSPELSELHRRVVEPTINGLEMRDLYISPNARIAVLKYGAGGLAAAENVWLSPYSLDQSITESAPHYAGSIAITDGYEEYYIVNEPVGGTRLRPIVYRRQKSDGAGQRLCDACIGLPRQVLGNGLLIVDQDQPRASFALVSHAGEIQHEEKYGDPIEGNANYVFGSKCDLFAFSYGRLTNSLSGTAGRVQIVVFDTDKMKEVFRIKAKASPQRDSGVDFWPQVKISISPDGRRVATLYGLSLSVFPVE